MNTIIQKPAKRFTDTAPGLLIERVRKNKYADLPGQKYKKNTVKNSIDYQQTKYEEDLYSANPAISEFASRQLAKNSLCSINILAKALRQDVNHVAINAAIGIGIIGPAAKFAIFDLVWMLRHSNKERRKVAAATLGLLKSIPRVSVYGLAKALKDVDLSVRQHASAALGEFNGKDLECITNELQRAINDDDANVKAFAKYALSKTTEV